MPLYITSHKRLVNIHQPKSGVHLRLDAVQKKTMLIFDQTHPILQRGATFGKPHFILEY